MNPDPARPQDLARTPGVLVLGMHRSGTSVITGIMEHLGFDGGPRATMLAPDEHNSDGYWEQRPLVEWHDELLRVLGGWASAPPPPATVGAIVAAAEGIPTLVDRIPTMFSTPWFLKDPRQCLLLPAWDAAFGSDDLAVIVARDRMGVIDSLVRRNNYSNDLAAALWERYNHDLLRFAAGRRCTVVRYDELLADPVPVVARLIDATAGLVAAPDGARVDAAVGLVRARRSIAPASTTDPLWARLVELTGAHDAFDPGRLPDLSSRTLDLLERRRRWLNRLRPLLGSTSASRASLDRIPARVRDLIRRRTTG